MMSTLLPCGHSFCTACINKSKKKKCPACKEVFKYTKSSNIASSVKPFPFLNKESEASLRRQEAINCLSADERTMMENESNTLASLYDKRVREVKY